jgi:site-specific DNA-adenine methylase
MWSYYGSKTNIVDAYPRPKHSKIIEPFAGTARYALKYFDRDVLLVDKYEVIVKIWQWLQKCSSSDILGLPRFKKGDNINDVTYDCEEARLLTGFLVGFGFATPRDTATVRLRNRPNAQNYTIGRIAAELYKIRHWTIRHGSYNEIENEPATWFVDPPYQFGGHAYKHSNKKIDFDHLSQWSRDRKGQVIVCENTKATWMDFKPLVNQNCLSGKNLEAIWTNEVVSYAGRQLEIA